MRGLLIGAAFGISFAVGLFYASWALVCRAGRCPAVEVLDEYTPRQTSKLYAADGSFIAEIGLERRTVVKLEQIPPIVRKAFVATEDKRFYEHAGVDWKRVPAAIVNDVRTHSWSQGFSTITMQLARNIFPERISREKNLVDSFVRRVHRLQRGIHSRAVPQSDLSGQWCVRRRECRRALLRKVRERSEPRRSGDARVDPEGTGPI